MFDTKVLALIGGRPQHHHTRIEMVDPSVEKGAKHLDKVQQAAQDRIVEALLLTVPSIEVSAVQYESDIVYASRQHRHRLAFKLNGRPIDVGLSTEEYASREAMVAKIAEAIAGEVIRNAAPAMVSAHQGFRRWP